MPRCPGLSCPPHRRAAEFDAVSANYYSDRELGPRPRTREDIPGPAWGGLISIIRSRIGDGSFADAFPETCPDSQSAVQATDERAFALRLCGEIPDIPWPLRLDDVPPTLAVLDLLEFCYQHIARSEQGYYHHYFN